MLNKSIESRRSSDSVGIACGCCGHPGAFIMKSVGISTSMNEKTVYFLSNSVFQVQSTRRPFASFQPNTTNATPCGGTDALQLPPRGAVPRACRATTSRTGTLAPPPPVSPMEVKLTTIDALTGPSSRLNSTTATRPPDNGRAKACCVIAVEFTCVQALPVREGGGGGATWTRGATTTKQNATRG